MLGQTEATVLLARTALETCLLGLYSLHNDDVVRRLRGANVRSVRNSVAYLVDAGLFPQDVIDDAIQALGEQTQPPNVRGMAEQFDVATGSGLAGDLYNRFYVPISAFFMHANGASLLRHLRPDGLLADRPTVPWTRRSAVRLADACIGIMAGAIAHRDQLPSDDFESYANAHLTRALTPVAVLVGRELRSSVKWAQLPEAVRHLIWVRRYYRSGAAATDSREIRARRTRDALERVSKTLGVDSTHSSLRPVIEFAIMRIITEWEVDSAKASGADAG